MSKFQKVRFCDKCLTSVPVGDVYYERGEKEICSKCNKKGRFRKSIIAVLVFGLCFYTGLSSFKNLDNRIETNTQTIEATADYVYRLSKEISAAFREIDTWAGLTEQYIRKIYSDHRDNIALMKLSVESLKEELADIVKAQKIIKSELTNGQLTNEKAYKVITLLIAKAKALDDKLKMIDRNPHELMEKVIKPTVGIAVRDKKGDHLRGSGVLFKRVQFKDEKGRTMYRYYGFTAYHVWHGVFKYIEDNKDALEHLQPKLLIQYYGGQLDRPLEFKEAEAVFPNSFMKAFVSQQDVMVFSFVHHNDKLAIAELASDAEIMRNVKYGHPVFTAGIALNGTPTLYSGIVANPKTPNNKGTQFHAFAYYGQSGGPTFDAKTLKVIAVNQRVHVHPILGGADGAPNTNVMLGHTLKSLRELWKLSAPKEAKNLLDP